MNDIYVCPQCGPDSRGSDVHTEAMHVWPPEDLVPILTHIPRDTRTDKCDHEPGDGCLWCCHTCDIDRHVCPGCGVSITHREGCCLACKTNPTQKEWWEE